MAAIRIIGKSASIRRIKRLLQREGHNCIEADEARVRSDLVLIALEGQEREIRRLLLRKRRRQSAHVPVVLVTSRSIPRLPGELKDLVDDVITDKTSPSLARIKIGGLLRLKDKLDRLNGRCGQMRDKLRSVEAVARSIDMELELASKLQSSLFPPADLAVPGSRFATKLIPASIVSGDFYDIFRLDENHVGFYVADARGHGVPAALLTIYVKKGLWVKEIKASSYRIVGPAEALTKLNEDLIAEQFVDIPFVTMFYAIYDSGTGKLTWSNAGHPPAMILGPEGDRTTLESGGALLGVMQDDFEEGSAHLDPGDKVIMYTDGVEAVRHSRSRARGEEVFHDLLSELAPRPIDELVSGVFSLGLGHLKGHRPQDDITLLGMQPKP